MEPLFVASARGTILKPLALNSGIFVISAFFLSSVGMMISALLFFPIVARFVLCREIRFYENFLISVHPGPPRKILYSEVQYCAPIIPKDLWGKVISSDSIDGMELYFLGRKERMMISVNPMNKNLGVTLFDWLQQKMQEKQILQAERV